MKRRTIILTLEIETEETLEQTTRYFEKHVAHGLYVATDGELNQVTGMVVDQTKGGGE